MLFCRVLSAERVSRSQVEPEFTTGELLESSIVSQSHHVLEEHAYLEIIDDAGDYPANEEPHYHEIQDSVEVLRQSHVTPVQRSSTASDTVKTEYQSLDSATRDLRPRTETIPDYVRLGRTNETAFIEHV